MDYLIEVSTYLHNFLLVAWDYVYITILKYLLFIVDNYVVVYPAMIVLLAVTYVLYNYTTYKRNEWWTLFFLSLIAPISLIVYVLKLSYSAFERFIYYKIWGIDYMNDVPRRKRDYILERSVRNTMMQKMAEK